MVREVPSETLEKQSVSKLKERLKKLEKEHSDIVWDLETESGIGKCNTTLRYRQEIVEDEIAKTEDAIEYRD